MSERLHCDYCDKYLAEGTPQYELEVTSITAKLDLDDESIPFHHIRLDLCSEECLKKPLTSARESWNGGTSQMAPIWRNVSKKDKKP